MPRTLCYVCQTPLAEGEEPRRIRGEPAHRDCVSEHYSDRDRGEFTPLATAALIGVIAAILVVAIAIGVVL